jgi:hypothetical protein
VALRIWRPMAGFELLRPLRKHVAVLELEIAELEAGG